MKLVWDNNLEFKPSILEATDISVKYQQELLQLSDFLVSNSPLNEIISILQKLPTCLNPFIYSIFLHLSPLTYDFNDILAVLVTVVLEDDQVNENIELNSNFKSLLDYLNTKNIEIGFNEFNLIGLIKNYIKKIKSFQTLNEVEIFLNSLSHKEKLINWFNLNVRPSYYFFIDVKSYELISNLNKLNEFIDYNLEKENYEINNIFNVFLKNVNKDSIEEFNTNKFNNLTFNEYKLILNILKILNFDSKIFEIIKNFNHDETSLNYSLSYINDENLIKLINLSQILNIYDLNELSKINEMDSNYQIKILNQINYSNLDKNSTQKLINSKIFVNIPTHQLNEILTLNLLRFNRFELINQLNYNQDLLIDKFWFYFKNEFNNCYKILDYLPNSYTELLSSISSLPEIKPIELINNDAEYIIEKIYQSNPNEYKNYLKYLKIFNSLSELLPNLQTSLVNMKKISIEFGILENDFSFIINESTQLNDWLLVFKVAKFISINYSNDEITDLEIIDKTLLLLLNLLKFVPINNFIDVLKAYQNLINLKKLHENIS